MQDGLFSVFPNEKFVDLGLYQFGWERCDAAHAFGPAARAHFLFHYILSGRGTFLSQDAAGHAHAYQLESEQGFLIFPNQISTYIADERCPWEYVWLEFDGLRAKEAVAMTGLSADMPIYHMRSREQQEIMVREMLYIARHADMSPFHLIGHLYLFMDAMIRSVSNTALSAGSRQRDFYIHEAIAFIERNYQNAITIEDIADNFGLNRSYFSKIFRDSTGSVPQAFLLNYRMTKAAELLKLTRLSVSKIGKSVGYENPLQFSRAYKSVYGISPSKWREQNQIV